MSQRRASYGSWPRLPRDCPRRVAAPCRHGHAICVPLSRNRGRQHRIRTKSAIACTLANAPEVVLLDEPTSALDEESARGVEDLVIDIIRERRMTCVIDHGCLLRVGG